MKIKLGRYPSWGGPYQIADVLRHLGFSKKQCEKIGTWISGTYISTVCDRIYARKKRKISIHLDPWDSWCMSETLSHIILPMLLRLKKSQPGAPFVDPQDVPVTLRNNNEKLEDDYDTMYKRWKWILNEMIWTFEQLSSESSPVRINEVEEDRIKNGLLLFGKYFRNIGG
ncbi:MAG: hypothetical protein ACRCUT_06765 [Spirochaetota bacterium]